jgi:chromosome segregation ATPase
MSRLVQWIAALFGWEEKPRPRPADAAVASLREAHHRKIDGFNLALAAAANLRDLLQGQLDELRAREVRLQARLQTALGAGDELSGAPLALELQNLAAELAELGRRREEAVKNAVELQLLRDEAIAEAQAGLRQISGGPGRIDPDLPSPGKPG